MKTDIDTRTKKIMSLGRLFTLKNVVFCTIGMICFGLVSYRGESTQLNVDQAQQGIEFNFGYNTFTERERNESNTHLTTTRPSR